MNFQDILFYIFSIILVASALGVITVRNPVYSALLLVLAFVTCAGSVVNAGSGIPGNCISIGVCRRGNGIVPICSNDA